MNLCIVNNLVVVFIIISFLLLGLFFILGVNFNVIGSIFLFYGLDV